MKQLSKDNLVKILTFGALGLMILAYFLPIWWVSLTAPNYPKETFPDGIRIHFAFSGVTNGCSAIVDHKDEIYQGDLGDDPSTERSAPRGSHGSGLDCAHEMDTINHYVGMYPIATGSPVETKVAKYIFGVFGVMLAAFAFRARKLQLAVLAVGFAVMAGWIGFEMFAQGRAAQIVQDYQQSMGYYFKDLDKIAAWGSNLSGALNATTWGLFGVMIVVLIGVALVPAFSLLLPLIPAMLPVFFIVDYAGWLWFFGHNLHPWGAFTLKPFMPTVFGEGKVAQFSTYSYPHFGFFVLLAASAMLLLALLIRRKQMKEESKAS